MLKTCPACKVGRMVAATIDHTVHFSRLAVSADAKGWRCEGCGEELIHAGDMELAEEQIASTLVWSGASGGDVFRFIRKAIGISAKDLAELSGVAAETVSRWENDERETPRLAMALIGTMLLERISGRDLTRDRLIRMSTPPIGKIDVKGFGFMPPKKKSAALQKVEHLMEQIAAED